MNVAMIGLGKLGLPVACAMALRGHKVYGYDIDEEKMRNYRQGKPNLYEPHIQETLHYCLHIAPEQLGGGLYLCESLQDAVREAEIIFIAVPTPSLPNGAFDTSYVQTCLQDVAGAMAQMGSIYLVGYQAIAIISTVLPMTTRSEFLPLLQKTLGKPHDSSWGLCYNAQFISMGQVISDMLNPEFVLIGEHTMRAGDVLERFYRQLVSAPIMRMTLEEAELVKMIYNTFIGQKLILANTIMEFCDKIPNACCDVVSEAIRQATQRIISGAYLRGGMGDGGPCHGRDQRALDFLARRLHLSANPFAFVTEARRNQTAYIADIVQQEVEHHGLPVAILGLTFKPRTNLTDDSPSLLLLDILRRRQIECETHDAVIERNSSIFEKPHIYVLCTCHESYRFCSFPKGSVIVDVWRYLDHCPEGCTLIAIGSRERWLLPSSMLARPLLPVHVDCHRE